MLLWTLDYYLFELLYLFFSDIYLAVEYLDRLVVLFLVFWGTSIEIVPVYLPSSSAQGFLFLYVLTSVCCLYLWWYPFWQLWCDFIVLVWISLIISVEHFFHVLVGHLYIFGKSGYSGHLHIFNHVCVLMLSWMGCLFWILTLYQSYHLQIFLLFQRLYFC